MGGKWIAAALVLGCSAVQAGDADLTDDIDSVPGTQVVYYDVTGQTPSEVRADLNRKGIIDTNDGKRLDAQTTWYFSWRWRGRNGICDLSTAEVTFSAKVTLPRLAGDVPPSLAQRWAVYMAHLRRHEAGHLDFAYAKKDEVLAAIKTAPACDKTKAAAEAVLDVIHQHDRDYDAETRHGMSQGAHFP